MDNDSAEVMKQLADSKRREKDALPMVRISKTWRFNWDDSIADFFKKLFGRKE
jgi:hypothetical protein